jgi:maltose alpha-D-glucosyltransferase / alpha-amylase
MTAKPAAALPLITVESWSELFEQRGLYQLEPILPQFITARRWFRSKARAIRCIAIEDAIPVPQADSCILVLRIEYADQGRDHYLLPISTTERTSSDELLATAHGPGGSQRVIASALSNPKFRNALLDAIFHEERWAGRDGDFVANRTSALQEHDDPQPIESFVSRAEQSNTSVIYRDRYILKLFRQIEPGINPDLEIGTFLTEHGFAHTPAVLGTLTYRSKGGDAMAEYAAGILQQFVPNQGDAWKYTLESLSVFFGRALARNMEGAPSQHPLELMNQPMPAAAHELIGDYIESAKLLGKRTAQMHAAMSQSDAPDFAPEPFTQDDAEKLYQEMLGQADITFELLRRTPAAPEAGIAEGVRRLLNHDDDVTGRFSALRNRSFNAVRIRHHGDYHLGQVLYTGSDFKIIDFEGEPARPLAARRMKTLAMRDVAGMIRSFQYAAFAALFGQVAGVPSDRESASTVESWAAYWSAWVSAVYLRAYFEEAGDRPFVPRDPEERKVLFDAFLLQKALYEVAYEVNNRPDWLRIPLRGILTLIASAAHD